MAAPDAASEWSTRKQALVGDLQAWWGERTMGWDSDAENDRLGESGLWHHMPEIDSKEVVRAMHLFEKHLGVQLDLSMIQPGGYDTVENMAEHLVPQLQEKAKNATTGASNG